ncbi:MAG: hypothetical protein HY855_05430 [Burkholderiales bacterium]|nr:hypothetical protein [Burkholderiales bacterium]
MCNPPGEQRRAQRELASGERPVREAWDEDEPPLSGVVHDEIAVDCVRLVQLTVQGVEPAQHLGRHWAVVNAVHPITVRATTAPDDGGAWSQLRWQGATPVPGRRDATVSRQARLPARTVSAALDVQQTVDVEVVDLLDIEALVLRPVGDRPRHWKAYESVTPARLQARVNPPEDWVRAELQWAVAVPAGGPGQADVDLSWPALRPNDSTPEERQVSVTLGTVNPKTLTAEVRVCRWPVLQVQRVVFNSLQVCNDGVGDNGNPFDRAWVRGRGNPAAGQAAATTQSVLCYVRGKTIRLSAVFNVTQRPSEPETVLIRGSATHNGVAMHWERSVTVNPGDATINFPETSASVALSNVVHAAPLHIDWTMNTPTQPLPQLAIGATDNPLYLLLGRPRVNQLYLTLLHHSCTRGAGTQAENAFVPAAFAMFQGTTGNGNGIQRMGDNVRLTYYRDGVNTPANANVWVTHHILGSADATARCGGWMDMMVHMLKMHGITSARGLACERRTRDGQANYELRFLVSQQAFNGLVANGAAAPYRNLGNEIHADTDIPGQGKNQPQFEFGDHVIVWHNDQVYDPSYGTGPFAAAKPWHGVPAAMQGYEQAAIGGFGDYEGTGGYAVNSGDGTPQQFAWKNGPGCVLLVHVCSAGQTLDQIARRYADRVYKQLGGGAQRRQQLRNDLLAVHGAGPFVAGTRIPIVLPRAQGVLKWMWS